jgi:hypothetical protein
MPKRLVINVEQGEPYILNESNDAEAIFSLHVPLKIGSNIS